MPPHPSSSVQKAREDLAGRLREIRRDAGITGFLQTPGYATALLSSIADFRGTRTM
ncbi:hypothetical protein GCM10010246_60960 [Streptomyces cuspidosporus]|uniref:Uncharacterized protein n=1 Tax=Streptomyces cuspidosporus TaxID=66882 RepID=A0ABN3GV82_9ACTN